MSMKRCSLGLGLLLGARICAFAQTAETDPLAQRAQSFYTVAIPISVTIVSPDTAGETEPLEGSLPPGPPGTVEVDPSKKSTTNPIRPAAFRVNGRSDTAFALTLPARVALSAHGAFMEVTSFKVSIAGGPSTDHPGGLVLNSHGLQHFKVGATLNVAPGQPRKNYLGRYPVTLAYN